MNSRIHRPGLTWLLAIVLFIFVMWAGLSEIDQTVRAQGQIIPSARTQVLQAADTGVVKQIRVREGQAVRQGQVLAELEQDRSLAAVEEGRAKLAAQQAALERLHAEAEGRPLKFTSALEKHWPGFIQAQRGFYAQHKTQLDAEIAGQDASLALTRDELAMHERLLKSGDVALIDVMRLKRQVIEIETRRRSLIEKFRSDAHLEITRIEEERSTAGYRLDERESVLRHTEIRSPMAGVVKYIRVTTEGGVLRQGDELMQISPADEEALFELKISPADVGQLSLGLPATIRVDAFDSSLFGSLQGELVYLSPDTLVDQGANGQQNIHYRAHVRVVWPAQSGTARIRPADLKAGMTGTVDIRTGSRSVLTYLFKPIHKAFAGAMTER